MERNEQQNQVGSTGTATAVSPALLHVAVKDDDKEQVVLGTWANPPAGYRFAREHEIRDVLSLFPAPTLRDKIFDACTGNQIY